MMMMRVGGTLLVEGDLRVVVVCLVGLEVG